MGSIEMREKLVLYAKHPSAIVDEGAEIGEDTHIWHWTHIRETATIGKNCSLGQGCYIDSNVVIGNNCKIQNGVSLYEGAHLEDFVFIGPHAVFTNVRKPRSAFPTDSDRYFETLIKTGATIGANCTIVCGVVIGEWAFIGAGAVVTKDVPDYALVVGNPGRVIGKVNEKGERIE
jgi:UDP-2-acetamido-3-amino-2,3-dideoxy-glucuronate N-acetyltransferase